MENSAISLNLSGRKMRPKERKEIAISLYEQYRWGYGRISRAIGDNNKSNVQRWIIEYKRKKGELPGIESGEREVDKICGILRKNLKRLRVFYDVSQFMGENISGVDVDELWEISQSLQGIINKKG
jgi:transposase-like protein